MDWLHSLAPPIIWGEERAAGPLAQCVCSGVGRLWSPNFSPWFQEDLLLLWQRDGKIKDGTQGHIDSEITVLGTFCTLTKLISVCKHSETCWGLLGKRQGALGLIKKSCWWTTLGVGALWSADHKQTNLTSSAHVSLCSGWLWVVGEALSGSVVISGASAMLWTDKSGVFVALMVSVIT